MNSRRVGIALLLAVLATFLMANIAAAGLFDPGPTVRAIRTTQISR